MSTRRLWCPLALCLFAAPTACGGLEPGADPAELDDETIQSAAQPLNSNTMTFASDSGCSTTEKNKLNAAMNTANVWLNVFTPLLERCLRDSFLSFNNVYLHNDSADSVETILARMRENLPTSAKCLNCADCNASAAYSPGQEHVNFDHGWLASASHLELAGVIMHEVSHNKGYGHPGGREYDYTVPHQLATCLSEIYSQPNLYPGNHDVKRSELRGEVEQSLVGAGGGYPYELACTSGAHVKGVSLGVGSYGGYTVIKQIAAYCNPTNGGSYSMAQVGGSGWTGHWRGCPAGYRATGIYGRSGWLIDSMGLLCTPTSKLLSGTATTMYQTGLAGGGGGRDFRRECPAGMAISNILGRSGAAIDQLRIVCQDVNEKRGGFHKSAVFGAASGYERSRRCSGYGAMVGIYGQFSSTVNRLGGRCMETRRIGSFLKFPAATADTEHLTAANGEDWNKYDGPVERDCPAGQLMVGLALRTSNYGVNAIAAKCASPFKWKFVANAFPYTTPMAGGSTGTIQTYTCPKGYFVVGLDSWFGSGIYYGDTIKGVRLVCRAL